MRLDRNPVFRRIIVPWYDSEVVCLLVLIIMFLTFLFGITGISVARETPEYHGYLWVPLLIALLSSCVIMNTTIRLIKRYIDRYTK